jgi:hypothetical protein
MGCPILAEFAHKSFRQRDCLFHRNSEYALIGNYPESAHWCFAMQSSENHFALVGKLGRPTPD